MATLLSESFFFFFSFIISCPSKSNSSTSCQGKVRIQKGHAPDSAPVIRHLPVRAPYKKQKQSANTMKLRAVQRSNLAPPTQSPGSARSSHVCLDAVFVLLSKTGMVNRFFAPPVHQKTDLFLVVLEKCVFVISSTVQPSARLQCQYSGSWHPAFSGSGEITAGLRQASNR